MALPALPHPHLVVLRTATTVLLSCLVAQAGWAAAFLGGDGSYVRHHQVGAWVTLVVAVLTAVVYVVLRRSAGPVNVTLALLLAGAVMVQAGLGASGMRELHIFVGVVLAMLGTALTSWTYRHVLPETVPVPVRGRAGG